MDIIVNYVGWICTPVIIFVILWFILTVLSQWFMSFSLSDLASSEKLFRKLTDENLRKTLLKGEEEWKRRNL